MYPIVVTVYDRLDLLKDCINSLLANSEAEHSVLYISSDYAYKVEDIIKINEVREYINNIKGFKEVIPIFHDKNIGGHLSGLSAINTALIKNDAFIFLEDDIMVSKYFLKYMNESLNIYKDNSDVYFICSYLWPNFYFDTFYSKDVFLWESYCPWGMGSWKNKWEKINFNLSDYKDFFSNLSLMKEFNKIDPNTIEILKADMAGKVIATDARISLYLYLTKKMSLFPSKTMCLNKGHDGKGTNGSTKNIYMHQELDEFNPKIDHDLKLNFEIKRYIYQKKYSFIRSNIYFPLLRFKYFKTFRLLCKKVLGI